MNPDPTELLTSFSLRLTGKGASYPSFELQLAKRGSKIAESQPVRECFDPVTDPLSPNIVDATRTKPFFRRASTPIRISHSIHTVHNHNPTTDQSKQ